MRPDFLHIIQPKQTLLQQNEYRKKYMRIQPTFMPDIKQILNVNNVTLSKFFFVVENIAIFNKIHYLC